MLKLSHKKLFHIITIIQTISHVQICLYEIYFSLALLLEEGVHLGQLLPNEDLSVVFQVVQAELKAFLLAFELEKDGVHAFVG